MVNSSEANMRKIRGQITCSSMTTFDPNLVVKVSIVDSRRMDIAAITVARIHILHISEFPISYELDYNENAIHKELGYGYGINCRIETSDGKLCFINDEHIHILDSYFNLLDEVNFEVIPVVTFKK